ncbi:DUF488 domain-containing protein [Brachybacterium sp. YJGR34]|uniref:DUF488 domain-containing protein n=1 Tax=Brachybacterium sp. YJGR34 TaxID=2059911 RepID=UPI000E0AEDE2|nr:DUF488 family protein [Brachybacterium sp. YJGR34]
MSALRIDLARVHDLLDAGASAPGEHRVLVDRLWPRGISKTRLALDEWDRDAAPSTDLRRALHHGEMGFEEFTARYRRELDASGAARALRERALAAGAEDLTLLFAAKDTEHTHALVLREALEDCERAEG